MSEKLTKYQKNQILTDLIEYRFKEDLAAVKKLESALATAIYEATYTKEERKLLASLPDNFVKMKHYISAQISGKWLQVGFGKKAKELILFRFPCTERQQSFVGGTYIAVLESEYYNASADYNNKVREATIAANTILNSVSTINMLVKTWPEVMPFLPDREVRSRLLPVIQTDVLNEIFKLPSKEMMDA